MLIDNEYNRNCFIFTILEEGSLTKAARRMNISQPALSMKLTRLEGALGSPLFDREKIPLKLTEAGTVYTNYLKKQKILLRELELNMNNISLGEQTSIIIGGPSIYVDTMIVQAVSILHKTDANCHINIINGSLHMLSLLAQRGELDFFLCTTRNLPDIFEFVYLSTERLYLCVPSFFDLIRMPEISQADLNTNSDRDTEMFNYRMLDGYPCIFMEEGQPLQNSITSFLESYQISPRNTVRVNQVTTGLALTAMGEGFFLASDIALSNCTAFDRKNMRIYAIPKKFSGRTIYAAYNKVLPLSDMSNKMISIIRHLQ